MADIWNKKKRSEVMSLIRSKGNKATELRLIRFFRTNGITGWRRLQKLPGKPDFVFRAARLCVFVDGCFWHGCPRCYRRPGSNKKYWDEKVLRNRSRDRVVTYQLRNDGWRVVRLWEHQLKPGSKAVAQILRSLSGGRRIK
ncbi:MAG TPA: very short patch repair endonuclease [Verrucomicrobiae bacterium]